MFAAGRNRLSDWLERCLTEVKAHPVGTPLVIALVVILAANLVLAKMHAHLSLGTELGLEILILFTAISVPILLTSAILWPELKTIYSLLSEGPAKATPILLRFVREEIRELGEKISDTRSSGIDLEPSVVTPWIRDRCFSVASGSYLTTDVLVPSQFMDIYPDYLLAHSKYVEEKGSESVRINLASSADLLADCGDNSDAFDRYEHWHSDNDVKLLHLEFERAKQIAEQCQLRKTVDFAIWKGEFAILVEYRHSGETNLRLALVDEPIYRRCVNFFERVREEASPFSEIRDSGPDLVNVEP